MGSKHFNVKLMMSWVGVAVALIGCGAEDRRDLRTNDTSSAEIDGEGTSLAAVTAPSAASLMVQEVTMADKTFSVTVSGGPGNKLDWVGLYKAGAGNATRLDWKYLSDSRTAPKVGQAGATLSFGPLAPGAYELRFIGRVGSKLLAEGTTKVSYFPACGELQEKDATDADGAPISWQTAIEESFDKFPVTFNGNDIWFTNGSFHGPRRMITMLEAIVVPSSRGPVRLLSYPNGYLAYKPQTFATARVSGDIQVNYGSANLGLVLRATDDANMYRAYVVPDDVNWVRAFIERRIAGRGEALAACLAKRSASSFRFEANGESLSFSQGGVTLIEASDTTYAEGHAGIFGSSGPTNGNAFAFLDNVKIEAPASEVAP